MSSNLKVNTILPSTGTSIGIGTAGGSITSNSPLSIASGGINVTGVSTFVTNTDGTTDLLTLHADADGTNNGVASIKLMGNAGNHAAFIKGGHTTNGDSILTFHTDAHASGINPEERLRITSTGNLQASGITTSNAGFMFGTGGQHYLYQSASDTISLRITSDGPYAQFKDESGNVQMGSASGDLLLSAGGSERLRIESNGYLGIGTDNPAKAIQVGSASSISQFQIHPHAAGWDIGVTSGDIAPHFQSKFILYNGQLGSGSERFRVSAEGFVTKIKHPSFRATREGTEITHNATSIQQWNTVSGANRSFDRYTDGGYGFNTSTYKYKVPVTGVWYFHASVYTNIGNSCMFDIRTSSQIFQRAEDNSGSNMPNNNIVHASVVVTCNKDDEVYVNQSGGQGKLIAGSGYISFGGHLIG